jgi:hypothetical protein
LVAPVGGAPHVPRVAPLAMSQRPVQQSSPRAQASPCCTQNDARQSHTPLLHRLLQHWLLPVQLLPAVRQESFSG